MFHVAEMHLATSSAAADVNLVMFRVAEMHLAASSAATDINLIIMFRVADMHLATSSTAAVIHLSSIHCGRHACTLPSRCRSLPGGHFHHGLIADTIILHRFFKLAT